MDTTFALRNNAHHNIPARQKWRGLEGHPRWSCAPGTEKGMEADDLLCSHNAPEFVCLVGWSVWFFWCGFRSGRQDKPDRRDRPDEPAFVGRAQWKINQPPSLRRERATLEGPFLVSFNKKTRQTKGSRILGFRKTSSARMAACD